MVYIPKNRIKTNLFTKGGEFVVLSTNEPYSGKYYKTYNGRFFSGLNPNDLTSQQLAKIPPVVDPKPTQVFIPDNYSTNFNAELVNSYKKLNNIKGNRLRNSPTLHLPSPTLENYNIGEFQRYFVKKRNENIFLEISLKEYTQILQSNPQIDYQSWLAFSIPWKLTGSLSSVSTVNKNIVNLYSKDYLGVDKYIGSNYIKFYNG